MLALDCPNGQTIRKGCAFCIMTIPCRCSVTSDNLYLPPRLGECNNNTNDITILHPVNLALLQEFFNEDTHSTIFGDTIFDEFVNLQIPSFHIFNHSFSQYLANDNKQHISLKRIAKAMKKDGTVFQTLAASMIAGKVEVESSPSLQHHWHSLVSFSVCGHVIRLEHFCYQGYFFIKLIMLQPY